MKNNTVKTSDGIEIYMSQIHELADDYINNTLNSKDDIYNKQCFAGMIKYIALKIGKPDYTDLVLLNSLWDIYTSLCYKYKATVSIERYCILIGISRQTFYSWINEDDRKDYSPELGSSRADMMKKWDAESESSWQDEASTGNPGPMFVLKARRNWQETAPAQIPQNNNGIRKSMEQIASEMGVQQLPDRQQEDQPEQDF